MTLPSIVNKVLKHHMFKDSAIILVANILLAIIGILLSVLLVRSLSMKDIGRYQLILSYMAIGQIATLSGMDTVITKGVLKGYDPIFYLALKKSIISSFIATLCLFIIGSILILANWAQNLGYLLLIVGFFLPIVGLEKYDSFFNGKRMFSLSRKLSIFTNTVNLLIVGGAAYFFRSFIAVIIALFISRAVTVIICLFFVNQKISKQPRNPNFEKALLKQGWQMSGLAIFNKIVNQIDKIILGNVAPSLLAIYHIGNILPQKIKDNIKTIFIVPTTSWSKLSKTKHFKKIKKHWYKFVLLGCACTLVIWITAPWLILLLYGEQYRESILIARLFSLNLPILFLGTMIFPININQEKGVFYQKMVIISQVLFILSLLIFYPIWGIYGIVASVILRSFIVNVIFVFIYLVKNRSIFSN